MTQRNFYQVLGVSANASQTDIRAAYVRLSKLHHPDVAHSNRDLPWRLHDVQQAYRCLSVSETRDAHDAMLAEEERVHFARQRNVQSRLQRYDRRHPRVPPRSYSRTPWRSIVAIIIAVTALVILNFFT